LQRLEASETTNGRDALLRCTTKNPIFDLCHRLSSLFGPCNAGSRRTASHRRYNAGRCASLPSAPRVEPCHRQIALHFLQANCYTKKIGVLMVQAAYSSNL
jgi:hypothetical protein